MRPVYFCLSIFGVASLISMLTGDPLPALFGYGYAMGVLTGVSFHD